MELSGLLLVCHLSWYQGKTAPHSRIASLLGEFLCEIGEPTGTFKQNVDKEQTDPQVNCKCWILELSWGLGARCIMGM